MGWRILGTGWGLGNPWIRPDGRNDSIKYIDDNRRINLCDAWGRRIWTINEGILSACPGGWVNWADVSWSGLGRRWREVTRVSSVSIWGGDEVSGKERSSKVESKAYAVSDWHRGAGPLGLVNGRGCWRSGGRCWSAGRLDGVFCAGCGFFAKHPRGRGIGRAGVFGRPR